MHEKKKPIAMIAKMECGEKSNKHVTSSSVNQLDAGIS